MYSLLAIYRNRPYSPVQWSCATERTGLPASFWRPRDRWLMATSLSDLAIRTPLPARPAGRSDGLLFTLPAGLAPAFLPPRRDRASMRGARRRTARPVGRARPTSSAIWGMTATGAWRLACPYRTLANIAVLIDEAARVVRKPRRVMFRAFLHVQLA
eukprot:256764-Chlamydomonas_euryale.AAC.1